MFVNNIFIQFSPNQGMVLNFSDNLESVFESVNGNFPVKQDINTDTGK